MALGLTVLFAIAGLFSTLFASGVLVTSKTIATSGVLATANLGIYSDSACTQSLNPFNWGTISPGGSATKTLYVKNLGTVQVTLSLSATNWNPTTANGPIALSWNREGAVLAASQVTTATLTLSTSSTASGITTFNVDVVISGTG
jgi:hypothetical protein